MPPGILAGCQQRCLLLGSGVEPVGEVSAGQRVGGGSLPGSWQPRLQHGESLATEFGQDVASANGGLVVGQ